MKKYFLAIGLVAFLMTSCCEKQENKEQKECCKDKKEQCDKHHECDHHGEKPGMCPEMMGCMDKMVETLANWENLSEEQRAEAIDMAKKMQEMKANMPKHECKHEGKCEKHEGECKHGEGHKCEGNHEGCKKHEGGCKHEGNCKHEEGKKCEGNHEGCQHQHENCEHHQDK